MKKVVYFVLAFSILLIINLMGDVIRYPKKIIEPKSGFVVIREDGGKLIIQDPNIKKDVQEQGIPIPYQARARYDGKEVIRMKDPKFKDAFFEFYCSYFLSSYDWKYDYDDHQLLHE